MREVKLYHPAHGGPRPKPGKAAKRGAARRADPAPSRWAYRRERLMLTPGFRFLVKGVLPTVLVVGAVGLYFQSEDRRAAITDTVQGWIDTYQNRPQFIVDRLEVAGASQGTEAAIRVALSGMLPLSSFDLDLPIVRAQLETLPAVADAALQVRSGGVLYVAVTERVPVVIWRRTDGLMMLDPAGELAGQITNRVSRPGLPLIAGKGAEKHVPEALALFAAAEPLKGRLRGLERIGERRWDVVLDRNQRIMLPERKAVSALEQVLALHQAQELLDRDVAAVDMRLATRPTVRLTPEAASDWRDLRDVVIETAGH